MNPDKPEEFDEAPAGSDLAALDSVHEARELSHIWQKTSTPRQKQTRLSFGTQTNRPSGVPSEEITRSLG